MVTRMTHEALALVEIDGLPRCLAAQDAALKRAPVTVLCSAPLSPGKAVLIFAGGVAAVEESLAAALAVVGERLVDQLFLPGVDPEVLAAVRRPPEPALPVCLAILELTSLAATLRAADAAVKTAAVRIGRLHLGSGFGGKGYFTLLGPQAEVEAAVLAAAELAGEKLTDHEIIPAPHEELAAGAFVRPWPLDPASAPRE